MQDKSWTGSTMDGLRLETLERFQIMDTGPPHIRFYAGAPLFAQNGCTLGNLAVLDRVPRVLTETQMLALRVLSKQVVAQLELRKNLDELSHAMIERDKAAAMLNASHRELEQRVDERTSELNPSMLRRSVTQMASPHTLSAC